MKDIFSWFGQKRPYAEETVEQPTMMKISSNRKSVMLFNQFHSKILGRSWNYSVILPPDYENGNETYPVVFMLHGWGASETLPEMGTSEIMAWMNDGSLPPAIYAGVRGSDSWFLNRRERFEDAFMEDFVTEISQRYRTQATPAHQFLCGFSMGGYAATRFLMGHPGFFGRAALLSPAIYDPLPPLSSGARLSAVFGQPFDEKLWIENNYPTLLDNYVDQGTPTRIMIAAGYADIHVYRAARRMHRRLCTVTDKALLVSYGGGHVPPTTIIYHALRFLLSPVP